MSTAVAESWDVSQLMGGMSVSEQPTASSVKGKGVESNPLLWGVPGHLSKDEADVYVKFKDTVERRGGEFRETVYSFGEEEGEVWALCRWLRARKFVYDDVVKMIEEATQVRKEAKSKEFYPNPVDALGVDPSVFFAQYPQLYSGLTKLGVPIFISKPGILNVDGIECITTLDGIIKFHWHVMMHDFANRLLARKEANPDTFKRCVPTASKSKSLVSSLIVVLFAFAPSLSTFSSFRSQVRVLLHLGLGRTDNLAALVAVPGHCQGAGRDRLGVLPRNDAQDAHCERPHLLFGHLAAHPGVARSSHGQQDRGHQLQGRLREALARADRRRPAPV
jgi:hypothetical protein